MRRRSPRGRVDGAAEAALAEWSSRIAAEEYDEVRERYFGSPAREFFDWCGKRYEVTTEAVWDAGTGGDLRVLIEVSDASASAPRTIHHGDLIVAKP